MSLKFKLADWRFELTWRELRLTPIERTGAAVEPLRRSRARDSLFASLPTLDLMPKAERKAARQ